MPTNENGEFNIPETTKSISNHTVFEGAEYIDKERNSALNVKDTPSSDSENISKPVSNSNEKALIRKQASSFVNERFPIENPLINGLLKTEEMDRNSLDIVSFKDFQIALLKEIHKNDEQLRKKDEELRKKDEELREKDNEQIALFKEIQKKDEELLKKDNENAELKIALMEKGNIIALLKKDLKASEDKIEALKRTNGPKIASLKNKITQLENQIKSQNSSNKLLSFNSLRYESTIRNHPEILWDDYEIAKKSIGEKLAEANLFIEAGGKSYLKAGLPMRMAAETGLSEICNLYNIPIIPKETASSLFQKTKHLFDEEVAKDLEKAIERCCSVCHSKKIIKKPDDFSFTQEEAIEYYNFFQQFYDENFRRICLKKLISSSILSKSTTDTSQIDQIVFSNLKNQNTNQTSDNNTSNTEIKERTSLAELGSDADKKKKRSVDENIDSDKFGKDSNSGSSNLIDDRQNDKQSDHAAKK